ncbi:MAG: hypothetical protein RLZ10_1035 [Bacteroidota bacterium]|jgi:hypothetical protein
MSYQRKYRILSSDELQELDPEFKQFLIVHGIFDEEWRKINIENADYAIEMVEIFSDTVLEKVYSKISFLEYREKEVLIALSFTETYVEQIRLQQKENCNIDFLNPTLWIEPNFPISEIDAYYGKKLIKSSKNEEIHSFIEQGFVIAESDFWSNLKQVIQPS